jgi:hypothetical protein
MDFNLNDYLVHVDVPEQDASYPVIVKNAQNKMHARLAAYYRIYKVDDGQPSEDRLRTLTTVEKVIFECNAKLYVNPYGA